MGWEAAAVRLAASAGRSYQQARLALVATEDPNMLVLSRHTDESIIIGDNIVVTVVDVRGDKVRLGIEAPTEIPVHRQEVYEAIQRENLRASQVQPEDTRQIRSGKPRGKKERKD